MSVQGGSEAGFSFRTFDIYRRIVEIVRQSPELLAEFKTGEPSETSCRQIAKSSYMYKLEETAMKKLVRYMKMNAPNVAEHAENPPGNWYEACDYTETYIKLIKRQLRSRNIRLRALDTSDSNVIAKLAEDIANNIHNGEATASNIANIRDYLNYDLKNPKRTLISISTPKRAKVNKESKENYEVKYSETEDDDNKSKLDELKCKMMSPDETDHNWTPKVPISLDTSQESIEVSIISPIKNEIISEVLSNTDNLNNNNLNLKRKNSIDIETELQNKTKKSFHDSSIVLQSVNSDFESIPYLDETKTDTNSDVNVEDDYEEKVNELQNNNHFESYSSVVDKDRYSQVEKMTYSEAHKLVDRVMAFCELKNEITLEEFLVLRRTRDKLEWRSLKEVKIENTLKENKLQNSL